MTSPFASSENAATLVEPRRQSIWAVLLLAVRTVRSVGLVQIAIGIGFVLARVPSIMAFIGLVAVVGMVVFALAAIQWWRYTFVIVSDELVVRRGILQQQTLSVPLDRVQSVSLEQKLLHRLVSVVQVTLDTAGTEQAEFVIDAVDQPVAEALRRTVANHRGATAAAATDPTQQEMPPPPEPIVFQHDAKRVATIALTQTPFAGLVLLAPLFAVADDLGQLIPFDVPAFDDPTVGLWLLWFVPLVLALGLVFSVALNLVRVLLADWNLTLRTTAAGLRRDAGLLSTTSVAATVPRVQMVGVHQSLLERWASLHTVTLNTIGAANLQLPGCDHQQMTTVRALALAESDGVNELTERVAPQNIFLATRNTALVATLAAIALWFGIGGWSLVSLVAVPYVWFATRRRVRLRRWGVGIDALAQHREFVGWDRQELLLRKVNAVKVRQSFFERKRDLATIVLTTAAGSVTIGMITLAQASQLRDHVLHQVETDPRAWM